MDRRLAPRAKVAEHRTLDRMEGATPGTQRRDAFLVGDGVVLRALVPRHTVGLMPAPHFRLVLRG